MSDYYFPIQLNCENLIKEFSIQEIKKHNLMQKLEKSDQAKIKHLFPDDIATAINNEFISIGWPKIWYAQTYVRIPGYIADAHVDFFDVEIYAGLNIPIFGCANSAQIFYKGNYWIYRRKIKNDAYVHLVGTRDYHFSGDVRWMSKPVIDDQLELTTSHLVRVNKPHSVKANDTEYRGIMTIRFDGNPTYEDLLETYKQYKSKG